MKSLIRVKAFVLLLIAIIGLLQAFEVVPWHAASPLKAGALLIASALILTLYLRCEECDESSFSAVLQLKEFKGEERTQKRRELISKGYRLFAYRKRCIHCSLERY